jgi:protein-ribulosamine 3-kinase
MTLDRALLAHICERMEIAGLTKVAALSGGDINQVYILSGACENFVVKVNDRMRLPQMLQKEKNALDYFGNNALALVYAKALLVGEFGDFQFLVLRHVAAAPNKLARAGQERLGLGLAQQHRITNQEFGWNEDNYIGSLKQPNSWREKWIEFYAENRILRQTQIAFDKGLISKIELKKLEHLCATLNEIFPNEKPALLHGDLWGGNYFLNNEEQPFLFDPAVYFGHREMDIGMTQLFGGFTSVFITSYNDCFQLEPGWMERIPFTQLYPNLVHLNLFGRVYWNAIEATVGKF